MPITQTPQAVIDTLNGLLEGHLNSVFPFVLGASPYLSESNADIRRLLQEVHEVCEQHSRQLVELIESLGGVPRVTNRTPAQEQYLAYLSLKFLLPTLVNEKDLLLQRYENARAAVGKDHPQVIAELKRMEDEQCDALAKLKKAADEVTQGRFVPPKHSERCV